MATCLTCPPLSCSMDCQASKQLLSSFNGEATASDPDLSSIDHAAAIVAAGTSLHLTMAKIDQLPNEIKDQIVRYLQPDLDAIKHIRLVSRSWSFLGSPYLLTPTFTALPHRDDFTRLVMISRHPYFSQQIKTLNIFWMAINEEDLRLNLIAPHGGSIYEEESFRASWGQYRKMKGLIDLYSETFCNEHLLEEVFRGFTQLRELNVKAGCYLFSTTPMNTYLYDAWNAIPRSESEFLHAREHVHRILSALNASIPPTLRTVSINPFSSTFWGSYETLRPILEILTCLKLHGEWSQTKFVRFEDVMMAHEVMGKSLTTGMKLRELHITGYRGQRQLTALPQSLRGIRFPNLHTIVLKECDWPLPAIQDFLYNHRHSLLRVRLESFAARQSRTWAADLKALLTMMRDEMPIQKLDFQGEVGPRRGTQLAFDLLRRADGLYKDDWSQPDTLPKAFGTRLMALRIEDYVVRDGPYPDFAWDI